MFCPLFEISMLVCLLRGYVFRAQTQEIKERGGNQSTGIDFFITQERVIFLDTQVEIKDEVTVSCSFSTVFSVRCQNVSKSWTVQIEMSNWHRKKLRLDCKLIYLFPQPMLSPSILDHLINNDRKLPPEYNLPHTYVEMQVSGWPADGSGWKHLPYMFMWAQAHYLSGPIH